MKKTMTEKSARRVAVERRNDTFTDRPVTRIWQETASDDNPYIAKQTICHGYDTFELAEKRSFVDVLYLLFRGELPTSEQSLLLEHTMIAFINPGPRHPATRASMNAAVSNTDVAHLLPISLSILSNAGIEEGIRFLRKNARKSAAEVANELLESAVSKDGDADRQIAPGFGSHYGSIDTMAQNIADHLLDLPGDNKLLQWGDIFSRSINSSGMGWLPNGIVSAVLADMGFQPRAAAGFYQYLSAPGLLAHGIEMSNKPVTAMPFVADENYVIED